MNAVPEGRDGVLLADKPAGPTSHDLVAAVRRALPGRRVGHAGTLDPFATGLLLLLVGRATRLAEFASGLDKTYLATLRLGASSTTDDPEGEVRELDDPPMPDERHVRAALAELVGEIEQVPPRFSAKRVGGERAYRMARGGAAFTLEARAVRLHDAELVQYAYPLVRFRVRTGPGVYVRSLARDLGAALGSAGHLVALRRESIGAFHVTDAIDVLGRDAAALTARLLPPETAVAHLPAARVEAEAARALAHGRAPDTEPEQSDGEVRLLAPDGFLGVGRREAGRIRPRKILYPERACG